MRMPRLYAKLDEASGSVGFSRKDWNKQDLLLRLDLLRDWINALEDEYDVVREKYYKEEERHA